jgi:recombination protein RecA
MRIGVLFGNPETTAGGMALKFYSAVRLEMRRREAIKQENNVVGNRVKVTIRKNKVAAPYRQVEFDLMFDEGISREAGILDVATDMEIVEKRGAYFSYGELRLGRGRENVKAFLKGSPELADEIEQVVRERARPASPELAATTSVLDVAKS